MQVGTYRLNETQMRRLRAHHPMQPDQSWVSECARREGWLGANRRYLETGRRLAASAMNELLLELGLSRARSPQEALDLLELAFRVFAVDEEGFTGRLIREGADSLRIEQTRCPTFRLFEQQRWLGVTACASWHRRRGWLDALGVSASDTVLADQKWGDSACTALICVTRC